MELYYAILNFTLAGVLGIVGILTLKKVSVPSEVVFASIPLLFGLHQLTEGFVWLGVGGEVPHRTLQMAETIFIYYAQGVLPFLIPLAIWLVEKKSFRKQLLAILTLLGFGLMFYTLYGLAIFPSSVKVTHDILFYSNPWTANYYDATLYIITTCGALILSSSISIQIFGLLNLIGLTIIAFILPYGFTSVWCLYAAVISGLLYFYFIERRIRFLRELKASREKLINKLQEEEDELSADLEKEIESLNKIKLFSTKDNS